TYSRQNHPCGLEFGGDEAKARYLFTTRARRIGAAGHRGPAGTRRCVDGLTVGFVLSVHPSATGGLPYIDPVGGPVASSSKALCVHQRFQQQWAMPISGLPVVRQVPGVQRQNLTRQPLDSHPGETTYIIPIILKRSRF